MKNFRFVLRGILMMLMICSVQMVMGQENEQEKGHMQYGINLNGTGFFYQIYTAVDVTAGWRFNDQRFLGLGTGRHRVEIDDDAEPDNNNGTVTAIPLYLEYLRYFQFKKHPQSAFVLGVDAGGRLYTDRTPWKSDPEKVVPLLTAKLGFDFAVSKYFGLTLGLNATISDAGGIGANIGLRF